MGDLSNVVLGEFLKTCSYASPLNPVTFGLARLCSRLRYAMQAGQRYSRLHWIDEQ